MQTLDYRTPPERKPRSRLLYWAVFVLSYIPGMFVLDILDDVVHMRVTGHHNDGGVMALALVALPVFIVITIVLKLVFKTCNALWAAAVLAIFLPLLAYAATAIPSYLF